MFKERPHSFIDNDSLNNKEAFCSVFEKYKPEIIAISKELLETDISDLPKDKQEVTENVAYEITFKTRKDQPVIIVEFTLEGVSEELVLRPSMYDFSSTYDNHQAVQDSFPKLYGEGSYSGDSEDKFYIIEKVWGYEENRGINTFEFSLLDGEFFNRLCDEYFEMSDKILDSGLKLKDVQPLVGHNFIFDKERNKFSFFDIDTVVESGHSLNQRYLDLIYNTIQNTVRPRNDEEKSKYTAFLFRYLGKVFAKYQEKDFFQYQIEEPKIRTEVYFEEDVDLDKLTGIYEILTPTDRDHAERLRAINPIRRRGRQGENIIVEKKRTMMLRKFDLGLITAVQQGDFKVFQQYLESNYFGRHIDQIIEKVEVVLPEA